MDNELASNTKRLKVVKILLWSLLPLFIPALVLAASTDSISLIIIAATLLFTDIGIIYYYSKKFYNWFIYLFIAFSIGIIFKRNHWPFTRSILSVSTFLLAVFSMVSSFRFQVIFRFNSFLRWFGLMICLVNIFYFIGFLFRIQHWPAQIGDTLGYIGSLLFLIAILGMVFTLPNSNYLSWTAMDRKIFFRVIVISMIFLFVFLTIVYVFNDAFRLLLEKDYSTSPWSVGKIRLFDMEGISL
jgi:hypothetical protein